MVRSVDHTCSRTERSNKIVDTWSFDEYQEKWTSTRVRASVGTSASKHISSGTGSLKHTVCCAKTESTYKLRRPLLLGCFHQRRFYITASSAVSTPIATKKRFRSHSQACKLALTEQLLANRCLTANEHILKNMFTCWCGSDALEVGDDAHHWTFHLVYNALVNEYETQPGSWICCDEPVNDICAYPGSRIAKNRWKTETRSTQWADRSRQPAALRARIKMVGNKTTRFSGELVIKWH